MSDKSGKLGEFTFRYSEEDNLFIEKAKKQFKTNIRIQAIKNALKYLYTDVPFILQQYKKLEKEYNSLLKENNMLKSNVKDFISSFESMKNIVNH